MSEITLGSLFDGSGGFPLGGVLSGIKPLWASEIEPFPIRVTTKRFPKIKHYGDISTLKGSELEPVDIITFGSPCQNLSLAGKRTGLQGEQSSLFYEAIRVIKEMRANTNGKYPRFIVWENVQGAFSSNKGDDFRCVLEEICKIKDETITVPRPNKWENAGSIVGETFSLGWRLFDAQYWGVPQRRKRIYLVADFGGQCAEQILFKSEGLSGYSSEGFRTWQNTTCRSKDCVRETGTVSLNALSIENHAKDGRCKVIKNNTVQTLSASMGTGGNNVPLVAQEVQEGSGIAYGIDRATTLGTNNDQTLFQPRAFGVCAKNSNSMKSDNPNSGFYEAETSRTLDANGGNPTCNQGGIAVLEGNGSRPSHKGDGYKETEVMYTLNATEQHAIAYGIDRAAFNQGKNAKYGIAVEPELEPPMTARGANAIAHPTYTLSKGHHFTQAVENVSSPLFASDYKQSQIVGYEPKEYYTDYVIRRLTTTECARLQGFPDWWCDGLKTENPTKEDIAFWTEVFEIHRKAIGKSSKSKSEKQIIKWLQNPYSDSAMYKMWGNGVALPNVWFVLAGIKYAIEGRQDEYRTIEGMDKE